MLKIHELKFAYRKNSPPVLNGVNLELNRGEIGVILGKNGCGKTTLLKNILGIRRPDAGKVYFEDRDISEMRPAERARRIAYVPQDITFGELSVFDTVLAGRTAFFGFRARREDRRIAERVISDMGLSDVAFKNTSELSGGQRQKTAIARAMAQEPELMLFDEPTGNLDIAGELRLIGEVKRLAREKNIAVLTSLHDLSEALNFGDRFFLMEDGAIRYSGDSDSIGSGMIKDVFDISAKIIRINDRKVVIPEDINEA